MVFQYLKYGTFPRGIKDYGSNCGKISFGKYANQ